MGSYEFLHVLCMEAQAAFILKYLFKDVCTENSFNKYHVFFQSKGQAFLLPFIKYLMIKSNLST